MRYPWKPFMKSYLRMVFGSKICSMGEYGDRMLIRMNSGPYYSRGRWEMTKSGNTWVSDYEYFHNIDNYH